ncbi:MAG: DUF4438 domain-containing protein [bacterium]
MLRTNEDKLVKISVMGEISHPTIAKAGYNICADGSLTVLPGVGGITYNCRVGDPAVGLAADHVEPGVSIRQAGKGKERENVALNTLACVGNEVRVLSGDAKGEKGVVTGKHGGIEHVIVNFPLDVLEKLAVGDKMQVIAYGAGLELLDYPDVTVMNCDPRLLKAMEPKEVEKGMIEVPVAAIVPAVVMGSGLGSNTCYSGDYDIQMFDEKTVKKHGLGGIRFGDIVAIMDADHSYGRIFKSGAVSVGVVVHSDSRVSGHGPGVATLMTSPKGKIVPRVDQRVNLAALLRLREGAKKIKTK